LACLGAPLIEHERDCQTTFMMGFGFLGGLRKVAGMSALFTRREINSRIVVHKKSPLNKLLNKRPRISGKENNINKPLNNTTQKSHN
jgi:hypothetical protein